MMNARVRTTMAALALLAVAVLVFRPVLLDAAGAPFGAYNSPSVELTRADDSPHCALLADCQTVSIANLGLDLGLAGIILVLAGLLVTVAAPRRLAGRSWTARIPNPPPLSAS